MLVIQDGRYVEEDVEFHGCPMKQGDIVWLGLAQANRDPGQFANPDEFDLERGSTRTSVSLPAPTVASAPTSPGWSSSSSWRSG